MFLFQTFILQLEGKTKWKLFKPLQELPQEASPDLELSDLGEPSHEFDMQVSKKGGGFFFKNIALLREKPLSSY